MHTALYGILLQFFEAAVVVLVGCGLTGHNETDAVHFVGLSRRSDEIGVVRRQILGQIKAAGQMAVQYEAQLSTGVVVV